MYCSWTRFRYKYIYIYGRLTWLLCFFVYTQNASMHIVRHGILFSATRSVCSVRRVQDQMPRTWKRKGFRSWSVGHVEVLFSPQSWWKSCRICAVWPRQVPLSPAKRGRGNSSAGSSTDGVFIPSRDKPGWRKLTRRHEWPERVSYDSTCPKWLTNRLERVNNQMVVPLN